MFLRVSLKHYAKVKKTRGQSISRCEAKRTYTRHVKTDLTSEVPVSSLQFFPDLSLALQRVSTLLVKTVILFPEAFYFLLQTYSSNYLSKEPNTLSNITSASNKTYYFSHGPFQLTTETGPACAPPEQPSP